MFLPPQKRRCGRLGGGIDAVPKTLQDRRIHALQRDRALLAHGEQGGGVAALATGDPGHDGVGPKAALSGHDLAAPRRAGEDQRPGGDSVGGGAAHADRGCCGSARRPGWGSGLKLRRYRRRVLGDGPQQRCGVGESPIDPDTGPHAPGGSAIQGQLCAAAASGARQTAGQSRCSVPAIEPLIGVEVARQRSGRRGGPGGVRGCHVGSPVVPRISSTRFCSAAWESRSASARRC